MLGNWMRTPFIILYKTEETDWERIGRTLLQEKGLGPGLWDNDFDSTPYWFKDSAMMYKTVLI